MAEPYNIHKHVRMILLLGLYALSMAGCGTLRFTHYPVHKQGAVLTATSTFTITRQRSGFVGSKSTPIKSALLERTTSTHQLTLSDFPIECEAIRLWLRQSPPAISMYTSAK